MFPVNSRENEAIIQRFHSIQPFDRAVEYLQNENKVLLQITMLFKSSEQVTYDKLFNITNSKVIFLTELFESMVYPRIKSLCEVKIYSDINMPPFMVSVNDTISFDNNNPQSFHEFKNDYLKKWRNAKYATNRKAKRLRHPI